MLKSINTSIDINEVELLMVELEARPEFTCKSNSCNCKTYG